MSSKHQAKRRRVGSDNMQSLTAHPLELALCESLTSKGISLAPTLIYHLLNRIKMGLKEYTPNCEDEKAVEVSVKVVNALLNSKQQQSADGIMTNSWTNKDFSDQGTALWKAFVLFHPEIVDQVGDEDNAAMEVSSTIVHSLRFNGTPLCVTKLLHEYQEYLTRNKQIYEHITTHHQDITNKDWQAVTKDDTALVRYCEAANAMGDKVWVHEANRWMADYCVKFFHQGGMKKYFQRKERAALVSTGDGQPQLPSAVPVTVDDGNNDKIRLLDVGSCYNPIATKFQDVSNHFDVTAMDLCPADEEMVLKGDFLTLSVGERNSPPVIRSVLSENGQEGKLKEVTSLPAGNYDAVTMSLVLSYLPTAEARELMVEKTRRLLVSPESSGEKRTGLFLIVEKQSILATPSQKSMNIIAAQGATDGNTDEKTAPIVTVDDWKNAICSRGFHCVTYQFLPTSDGRKSHVFVFAATDEPSSLDPIKHRMLIKQEVIQNHK